MRGVAAVLAANGWIVDVPRLPGHGPEIRDIADYGVDEWIATVEAGAARLRADGVTELLVVGHSVGAALAIARVAHMRTDRLVVLAPFAWKAPRWQRLAGPLVRVVLPPGFRLFARMDLADPEVRRGVESFMPGLDLDDPAVVAGLRELRVPTRLFEQLFRVAGLAEAAAPSVRVPVLAIQGLRDTVAVPARTRELLARFPVPPTTLELDAEHDLLTEASPVRDEVLARILAFAR
jgi:esterase/lipase